MGRFEKIFDDHFTSLDNIEVVLKVLRNEGITQIDTVKLIRAKLSIPLSDADKIVLYSDTWRDRKENNIQIRNTFFDSLEQD